MKVSVITVCIDAKDTIADAIQSVNDQSYTEIEHVIVDGGSTDGTLDIIRDNATRDVQLISEPDDGLYYALNKGLLKASGDIVGIVHADDFLADPDVIRDVVDRMKSTEAQLVYSDLDYVKREDPSKVVRHWVAGEFEKPRFLQGWMPPHPTVWASKDVYEQYGTFDTTFTSAADYEWLLRTMYKHDTSCAYLNRVTVKMRVGGKSNASLVNRLKANQEDRKAWAKNDLQPKAYTLLFKPLSKLSQFIKNK